MNEDRCPRALVTGGGRRIGAVLVRRLADLGLEVWIHAFRSEAEAEALRASLPGPARHAVTLCDLGDAGTRAQWLASLPAFDLVVNNASVYRLTLPGERETAAQRDHYWEVNLEAPLAIIRHQYDRLNGAGGLAVNLLDSDILEETGGIAPAVKLPEGVDSYLETRRALGLATVMLARELAPGLRVNGIAPGPVLPPVDCAGPGLRRILARVPSGRAVAVEAIAATLEFLWRTPDLTGAVIPVDGGMHLKANPERA